MYKFLVVWFIPKKNVYYFKILKHNYNNYYVGYVNDYNHVVILFENISPYLYICKYNFNIKRKIINKLVSFLE